MSVKPQAKPINDKRREALSVEKQTIADAGSTATGIQAIEQTAQQFQLQQKVSALPEPTLSSTATRSLQDEGALRVAHDTGVDPHQATVGGTMETKVEALIASPKPAVLQNQKDGLNIWDLSNRAEGKQDDTDQRMRRLQDDHTRMEGELKLQHEEKCRLELNHKVCGFEYFINCTYNYVCVYIRLN